MRSVLTLAGSTLAALWLLAAAPAHALLEPVPLSTDSRIATVMYSPNEIYKFVGHYAYQSAIEFASDEEIVTISVGDSLSWMINPSGNRIFLKPVEPDAVTNMTVLTNRRSYLFELHAREPEGIRDPEMIFVLRFLYPNDGEQMDSTPATLDPVPMPELEGNPEDYNFRYTYSGNETIAPIRIFDDGEFTYFEFRDKNTDLPAFYRVKPDGSEELINFRTRGDYVVVERVTDRFTLRNGGQIVCVFNESMMPQAPPSSGFW